MTTPHPVSDAARALFAETPMHAAAGWFFEKFLLPEELDVAWTDAVREPTGQQLFEKLLEGLGVECECAPGDLHRVPKRGPVVAVANHPFGMVEGVILGSAAAARAARTSNFWPIPCSRTCPAWANTCSR